jgi:hypothetical protein
MNEHKPYLYQEASKWVSTFVLLGCVLITVVLVYAAFKANVVANQWNPIAESDLFETL